MKDKLKAIWRILRSKSYFYTVNINDTFTSNYEIGNQPKGLRRAEERVDIMFNEVDCLAKATVLSAKQMVKRCHNPQWIDEEITCQPPKK